MTEVLKTENMRFRYDRKSHKMVCDDPEIFVERFGKPREQGEQFLLHLRGLKIGFQTAQWWGDDKTRVEDDGTRVWSIDVLLCPIRRPTKGNVAVPSEHTNTYKFGDEATQNEVLGVINDAMKSFDGNPARSEAGKARAHVEFTPDLLRRIASGEYLR